MGKVLGSKTGVRRILLPVMAGALVLPITALAEDELSEEALFSDDNVVFTEEDLGLNLDEEGDFIIIEGPGEIKGPRMNLTNSISYSETVYEDGPKNTTLTKTLASGTYRISNPIRLRFVITENDGQSGNEQNDKDRKRNLTLAPRYQKWVNDLYSFYTEASFQYSYQGDEQHGTVNDNLFLKMGNNFTYGINFFSVTLTHQIKETDQYRDGEISDNSSEHTGNALALNYSRKVSSSVTAGFSGSYSKQNNDNNSWTRTVKPNVNYRFSNGIRTSFNVVFGKSGSDDEKGYDYVNVNFNNSKAINKTFTLTVNSGYRRGYAYNHGDTPDGSGDREGYFLKLALGSKF